MKTASDLASTFAHTKNTYLQNNSPFMNSTNQFFKSQTHRSSIQQVDAYQISSPRHDAAQRFDVAQNCLQEKLQQLQHKYLLKQIQTLRSMNIQKQFPSVLKQLAQRSSAFIQLQTQLSSVNSMRSSEQKELDSVASTLSEEITQLSGQLFGLQNQQLSQHEYEKVLLLEFLESFEHRIKNLLAEKEEKSLEKKELVQEKQKLQNKIKVEKEMIAQFTATKQKLLQDLKYTQNCQTNPLLMIQARHLKAFQSKSSIFEKRYLQQLTQHITPQYNHIHDQQHNFLWQTVSGSSIQAALDAENKIYCLHKKLNDLTEAKLKTSNEISVQLMKQHILQEQLQLKEEQVKKYLQLQDYVNNQPYCISVQVDQNSPADQVCDKQVVSINQLTQKVSAQKHQNTQLKLKLQSLTSQLSLLKSTQQNLTSLLNQVKSQHELRTEKMIVSNQILKITLEEKKHKYQEKLNSNKNHELVDHWEQNGIRTERKMFVPIDNSTSVHLKTDKSSSSNQAQGSSLVELKSRLMAKFQASKASSSRC